MKKETAMRHISRIDQYKKNQHGWWVRIHRDGRMIHKFFSDYAHGGSEGRALSEAKKYRDALLVLYPKPEHGNMFNRPNSRNKGNPPGVHKTHSLKRGYSYNVWQAGYLLPDGTRVNRKFHFSDTGRSEEEAKALAIKARNEGLKLIEKMMREKTEKRRTVKAAAKKKGRARATKAARRKRGDGR
ncbi:MAG: hypothetical protein ACR2GW_12765 [Pyrinomonadaceae bacterium]|nr:hypothetical protein [Pyrinomonadaceae bacterium]